jgi:hypothetical protein
VVTLDGRRLPTDDVGDINLAVDLPANARGKLSIEYVPPGQGLRRLLVGGGALIVLAAVVAPALMDRRRRGAPSWRARSTSAAR